MAAHHHAPGASCEACAGRDLGWVRGAAYSLYQVVDTPRARAYNTRDETWVPVFKPWERRLDSTTVRRAGARARQSDCADQGTTNSARRSLVGAHAVPGVRGRRPAAPLCPVRITQRERHTHSYTPPQRADASRRL
jgi:hypothetical protein